ncbi:putative receptor protein kinase ZmPK1 [Hordeum vulgare subsp. vulgare]|uniref:Receptor-like serine/threonine-protein kinase n=1 Tax=Hordeum vulgare subsp. vulgare TaxID=112509 RepID=A0A8I6YV90_HORVV|nr:putative receptor protein kinase ZmPK1 [Hordeum vulgare subsp. vulgare]
MVISSVSSNMDAHSIPLLLLNFIHLFLRISAREFLSPGSYLSVEDSSDVLHSPDGTFICGFNNISKNASVFSIWFSNTAEKTVVWSANHFHPVYSWGSQVMLGTDGRMIVKDYNGQLVWENNVNSSSKAEQAQLLDTGNLIVKGQGDIILWQSFGSPTDTLLPYQNITSATKLVSTHRLLLVGRYSFHFDDQHLLTLFYDEKDISFIYWPDPRMSVWEKRRNSFNSTTIGVLDSWGYFLGSDNLTIKAADWGSKVMRRLTLNYDGNLRLYSLNKTDGSWSVTWMAYPQTCSVRGLCGMNGICVYTPGPACACSPGHEIVDPTDRSKGCRPKFNLSCDGQEMFVKLPSTDFRGNDQSSHNLVSLDTCKKICLNDCNCKGFSYLQATGDCYPKWSLVGGVTSPYIRRSMYLKFPKTFQVSDSSIPHSQPFGSRYVPNCSAKSEYFTVDFLDQPKNTQSGLKSQYLYLLYGFLLAIFCVEVIFVALGCWFMLRRESKQLTGVWPAEVGYEMITNHFRRYTYKELQRATQKFKDQIGCGASGHVYKGVLKDKRAVAVKRLADINQGGEEFQHELSVIGKIYHMNLVRVWGFCSDGPHRILVLEYVENGSLDKTLFSSTRLLEWSERFKIALGVAKGLAYLHHECLEWVIHCDLKPENILLDDNLQPKISDFGLAKLVNRSGSNKNVSRIHGTRGYIAPEWVSSQPITAKVDVYSFGVVLLELLKGARVSDWASNADEEVEMVFGRVIRMLAENLMLEGGQQLWIADFIDLRLNGQFDSLQARAMFKLAVSCVEEDGRQRPTMENVVRMLLSVA